MTQRNIMPFSWAVALGACCSIGSWALGQPAGERAKVAEWMKTELARAAALPGQPMRLSWTHQNTYAPSPPKLAGFEAAIKDHPAHPLKDLVPSWRAHANGKPDVIRYQLWWESFDHYRVDESFGESALYIDQVRHGDTRWTGVKDENRVVDRGDAGASPQSPRSVFGFLAAHFLVAGLPGQGDAKVPQPVLAYDEAAGQWVATFADGLSNAGRSTVCRVRWDESLSRGFVVSRSLEGYFPDGVPDTQLWLPMGWKYQDYEYVDVLMIWCPKTVLEFNNNHEPCGRLTLDEIVPLSEAEFESVAALPTRDTPDPVRGAKATPEAGNPADAGATAPAHSGTRSRAAGAGSAGWIYAGAGLVVIASVAGAWIRAARRSKTAHASSNGRRGFTMVEVIVVIAVVAVLAALLIPALLHSRTDARSLKSLANCSQHTRTHLLYVGDHHDTFYSPPLPAPEDPDAIVTLPGGDRTNYWLLWKDWDDGIGDGYVDANERAALSTPFTQAAMFSNAYAYSCTFLAKPDFWNQESRVAGTRQYGANTVSDVRFPDKKSIIHDYNLFHSPSVAVTIARPWLAGFVDGSASAGVASLTGYPDGEEGWPGSFGFHRGSHPQYNGRALDGLHTLGGVRGRDRE